LNSAMRGSLRSSALGPPSQIPTCPASRAPRSGLLRLRGRTRSPELVSGACALLLCLSMVGHTKRFTSISLTRSP
ncbi:Multidrug/Oligosaccharidyl-lipid/Polysaccharide (MOP) Flippase transporter, partial [Phytophthora megakarya]